MNNLYANAIFMHAKVENFIFMYQTLLKIKGKIKLYMFPQTQRIQFSKKKKSKNSENFKDMNKEILS